MVGPLVSLVGLVLAALVISIVTSVLLFLVGRLFGDRQTA